MLAVRRRVPRLGGVDRRVPGGRRGLRPKAAATAEYGGGEPGRARDAAASNDGGLAPNRALRARSEGREGVARTCAASGVCP